MKIKLTAYPVKKAARAAGDAALDAAAVLQEGLSAAGRQAEAALSRVRLAREVRDIEEEIALQLRAAGEIMYAAHRGDASTQGQIEEIMDYIDDLRGQLEAHRREQETLKGYLICPSCGEANQAKSLYCENCGKPLSAE